MCSLSLLYINHSTRTSSSGTTASLKAPVVGALLELGAVTDAFWVFLLSCWVVLQLPRLAPDGAGTTLSAVVCSFTAVLTEVPICLARRGCSLWVMPL